MAIRDTISARKQCNMAGKNHILCEKSERTTEVSSTDLFSKIITCDVGM